MDQSVLLGAGATHEKRVLVADGDQPLRITLVYTDVPGFPGALPALVNDLDLTVIGPDGRRYQGNRFQDGESVRTDPVADRVNNVEAVHLSAPLPGRYIVQVTGHRVADDARQETPEVDQDFALVWSGSLAEVGTGVIGLDRAAYSVPGSVGIRLVDADLTGNGSVEIRVTSTTEIEGEPLILVAADIPGAFTNSITLSTDSAVADGRLQVAHGDRIEVLYVDQAPAAVRTIAAEVDLIAPAISSIEVTSNFGAAVISWHTDEPATTLLAYGTQQSFASEASSSVFTTDHEVVLKNLAGRGP